MPSRHLLPRVLLAGAVLWGGAVPAQEAAVGYAFAFRVEQTAEDEQGRIRRDPTIVGRGRARGPVTRIDFLPGTVGNAPGDWYLTRDDGESATVVQDSARRYYHIRVDDVRERLVREKGFSVAIEDLQVTVRDDGSCGSAGALALRCVEVLRRYRVRARLWLLASRTVVTERSRYFIADSLSDFRLPIGTFFTSRTELMAHRDPAFTAADRREVRGRVSSGVVRIETEFTEENGRRRSTVRRSISATDIVRERLSTTIFEVPAGYRLVDP